MFAFAEEVCAISITGYSFIAYCPECKEQRSASCAREGLNERLENGTDVEVASVTCGHAWKLSEQERRNLKKMLKEGTL
ncbi:MAG: hypothetical protein LAO06_08610 [Acidobacteriia bacterium]|nr:hypothetical protein [Terriglobia bacterium]